MGAGMPSIADSIVSSRLLIVQSKRLMLSSLERRLRVHSEDSIRRRSDQIRDETARANHTYRSAVLTWGSTTSREFRLIAYGSLAELAETLVGELRATLGGLASADQVEVASEVAVLEDLISRWRQSAGPSVSRAVA